MKIEIPDGVYRITLEHHPNQQIGTSIATIVGGAYAGKGFHFCCATIPWLPPILFDRLIGGSPDEN